MRGCRRSPWTSGFTRLYSDIAPLQDRPGECRSHLPLCENSRSGDPQSNKQKGPLRVILMFPGLSESLYPGVAFPGEAYGIAETARIFQYLRDLVECNTDMAMAKHLITLYHERLIPLCQRAHEVATK